jgi:hypothetical protein
MSQMAEKCTQDLGSETWRKRPLERRWRRWKNVQIDTKETPLKGVDWMNLVQDRNKDKQAFGYTVMNIRVPEMQQISWPNEKLWASQGRLCFMESTKQHDKLRLLYYILRAYYIKYAHIKANYGLCVMQKLLFGSVSMVL